MRVRLPPVEVSLKVGSLEGCRPGASCQSGHATTECEIDPLDKRGVHSSSNRGPKMSCQGIEIGMKAIAGEEGQATRNQLLPLLNLKT